jgi:hypothetical protein
MLERSVLVRCIREEKNSLLSHISAAEAAMINVGASTMKSSNQMLLGTSELQQERPHRYISMAVYNEATRSADLR